jgi:DNA-binding XRE family transcriptional regulator
LNVNGRKKNTRGLGEQATSFEVTCPMCGGSGKVAPKVESIGDRFRACRIKLSKTQAEVAPTLRISRAQLANLEGDRSRPGVEMLVRAADAFGVSVDYLLGRH